MVTGNSASRGWRWWQTGAIYQVYPRSFQDSDGDGIGDLRGIIDRLDYLDWLGVDAIWLSPIFPSPMADFGYDVANYCDVDPMFGSLADLDVLVERAHARGIRVLLDYVPNHTSSEHPWFLESRSSREAPRRDWYLWADARADGSPPNNWLSSFGGPAWTWDERTGQYYGHSFLKEQPDLNWRNPAVRAAMYDVLRFWLGRGVDGFRVDVLWLLIKDDQLRDNPIDPDWDHSRPASAGSLLPVHTSDRPEVHQIVAEMRRVLDEYDDRVLVGEIYLPVERLVTYYGLSGDSPGAHLPFNFQLLLLPWQAAAIGKAIVEYERALPDHGWPNWVLGNHDRPRIATRVGADQARVAAMLLLTLRGTPTLYYGDEIGMVNVEIPPDQQHDPARFHGPDGGRDGERTPMRWDASPTAGFTSGSPWLPMGTAIESVNVEAQKNDRESLLNLYRRLLALRRREQALSVGAWSSLVTDGDIVAFERFVPGRRLVVALNLGGNAARLGLRDDQSLEVLLSTTLDREAERVVGEVALRPNEGLVLQQID